MRPLLFMLQVRPEVLCQHFYAASVPAVLYCCKCANIFMLQVRQQFYMLQVCQHFYAANAPAVLYASSVPTFLCC